MWVEARSFISGAIVNADDLIKYDLWVGRRSLDTYWPVSSDYVQAFDLHVTLDA